MIAIICLHSFQGLREYIVLAQDRRLAERWRRAVDGTWSAEQLAAGQVLTIETIGGNLDLDALYSTAGIAAP